MASSSSFLLLAALLALVSWQATAFDPSPLQDFCVADMNSPGTIRFVIMFSPNTYVEIYFRKLYPSRNNFVKSELTCISLVPPVRVNGFVCKNPMEVNADDFFKAANLDKPRLPNKVGSNVTLINVMQIAGLNTLGISIARIDYAPLGQNPPHTHPRATEILTVLEGTLYVGFVTSNQPAPNKNKFFSKVLNKGDVFVFPVGLIHFQFNPNPHQPAVAIATLSSQNPGAITIANAVFGSDPPISDDVLAKAFQVEKNTIDYLQAQFWENNHY
uniref:Germin-like protein n=1 Tax=Aegilops tauschii subsp. strangulata TaxID=200361 RepID=A0A453JBI4_AEGTS